MILELILFLTAVCCLVAAWAALWAYHKMSGIAQESLDIATRTSALNEALLEVVAAAEASLPENSGKPEYDMAALRSALNGLEAFLHRVEHVT